MPKRQNKERIAKVLARAGVASRREVERMIDAGRVRLNGKPVRDPVTFIEDTRGITVDGKPVSPVQDAKLWLYHKPKGLVTTTRDPEGRPTVFENLPKALPRVVSVGRLDINTEGLLLLTNDGELARFLEHPASGFMREYRVRVYGQVDKAALQDLSEGITVDGVHFGPIRAKIERNKGPNAWLNLKLKEGKNREVKRVLQHLGLHVTRLIRTAYGPFRLNNMQRSEVRGVTAEKVKALKEKKK